MAATTKHVRQRGSRNKKKNMRTRIDISDIEGYLEDVRHDERMGGPVSMKSDEQLFTIDNEAHRPQESGAEVKRISRKQRAASKVLYSEAPVRFNDQIKAPTTHVHREPHALPPVKGPTSLPNPPAPKPVPEHDALDVWAPVHEPTEEERLDAWIPIPKQLNKPSTIARPMAAGAPKAKRIPTSASYNPSAEAHEAAVKAALAREAKIIQKDSKLRVPKRLPLHVAEQKLMDELLVQPQRAAEEEDEDPAEQGQASVDLTARAALTKPTELKTRHQRNREQRQRAIEAAARTRKAEAVRMSAIDRLRSIKKEIAERERELAKRKADRDSRPAKKPRLGKIAAPKRAPDVLLTDELVGSLKDLRAQGSVAYEFIDSLISKNMIEPRVHAPMRRRYKLKKYTKRTFKNAELQDRQRKQREAKASGASSA